MVQNLRELWQRMGMVQRVMLLAIVLGCAGAAALLVGWARKPHLVMLYSGLSPEDASKVVEKIAERKIAYELTDGGGTIKVPADKVYSLRLTMASQGLPTGGEAGYRILDQEKIGASPFTQRVNYVRAVEGELARTVELLEGVASARVHVVQPESALFAGQKKTGSATVVLRLKPAWKLSPANVAAIVHLVAGSVEGVAPEKVVLVDSRGRLLSGEGGDTVARAAGNWLDYKTQVEEYLARKAEEMLTVVLGANRATVRVHAVIDPNGTTETVETYDPEKRVVSQEEIKSKSSVPPATGAEAAKATTTKEENTVSTYLVSRTLRQKTDLPGTILSLSVAAFVDLSSKTDPNAPAPKVTVDDVKQIIQKAIGLKSADMLTVVETPFHPPAAPPAAEAGQTGGRFTDPAFLLDLARRFSLGLLVIGALLAMKILRKPRKAGQAAAGVPALETSGAPAGALLLQGGPEPDGQQLRAQITRALQDNPDEVKRLFLNWIEAGKGEG